MSATYRSGYGGAVRTSRPPLLLRRPLVRLGDVRAVVLGLRSVPKAWWNAAAVASATMTVLCVMARFSGRVNVRLETTQVWGATAAAFGFLGIAASAVIGRWSELLGSLGVAGSLGSLAIVWWMLGENRLQGRVVLSVSQSHGVHSGDTAGVLLALLAGAVLVRAARRWHLVRTADC